MVGVYGLATRYDAPFVERQIQWYISLCFKGGSVPAEKLSEAIGLLWDVTTSSDDQLRIVFLIFIVRRWPKLSRSESCAQVVHSSPDFAKDLHCYKVKELAIFRRENERLMPWEDQDDDSEYVFTVN